MATVFLRSQSGSSLLEESDVAPKAAESYRPLPETIRKAVAGLNKLGFKVEAEGVTLSISGTPELFEMRCGVKIFFEEKPRTVSGKAGAEKQFTCRSSQSVMHIRELDDVIDGIVLATPGIPF